MNAWKAKMKYVKEIQDAYDAGFNAGREDGIKVAIKVNLFQIIQYLGDKRGWKRERIAEGLKWLVKHADMMLEDYTTFKEVVDAVREEYGIIYQDGQFIMLTDEAWEKAKNVS